MSNKADNKKYEENQKFFDELHDTSVKIDNVLIIILAVVAVIISLAAIVFGFKDLGLFVFLVPLILGAVVVFTWLRFKVSLKLWHDHSSNINKAHFSTQASSEEKKSSNYSSVAYILLSLSGLSPLLLTTIGIYSIYLAVASFVIGFIFAIASVVKDSKSKTNKTVLIVYIVIAVFLFLILGTIFGLFKALG